jgi:RNA polymerase sigma-70 factor (ECF subfamily)
VEIRDLKEMVHLATRGDEAAAAALFDTYYPRVYRYALVKLRRPMDAEDVAAETFAKVLKELKRFKWKAGGFEAWLFRIASNAVVASDEMSPEQLTLQKETAIELNELIQTLSPDQREIIALRFAGGLDSEEIARVMGRKPNAVRQLQFRALSTLRERGAGEEGQA